MKSTMQEMDELRLAVGETEALAAMLLEFFDHADWGRADSLVVDRMGYVLGVLATAAAAAAGKFERFQIAFVDSRPVSTPVETFDYSDGTAPGDEDAGVPRVARRGPADR